MTQNLIKQFNDTLLKFMEQTELLTGSSYITQFKLLTSLNSFMAIDMYIRNILPYKHYIFNKNEQFFINVNIDESYMAYFCDITKLKQIFMQLDTKTKNNIWEYIQALTILADDRHRTHST